MIDRLRSGVYGALASGLGNRLLPVRLGKRAALYCNDVVGRPLAPRDELVERAEFERTRAVRVAAAAADAALRVGREPAPVVVFHLDKHRQEMVKIKAVLDDRKIPYQVRNIQDDEASLEAVKRDARGMKLPVVFIAGTPIGKAEQLTNLDQQGELTKLVYGHSN